MIAKLVRDVRSNHRLDSRLCNPLMTRGNKERDDDNANDDAKPADRPGNRELAQLGNSGMRL